MLLQELGEPLMSSTLLLPGDELPLTDGEQIRARLEHQLDAMLDGGHCGIDAHHRGRSGQLSARRRARRDCGKLRRRRVGSAPRTPYNQLCYHLPEARRAAAGNQRDRMSAVPQGKRVLSGMRPTGALHLGNYHGALRNWVELQYQYECYFFVADWHALTTGYEDTAAFRRRSTRS